MHGHFGTGWYVWVFTQRTHGSKFTPDIEAPDLKNLKDELIRKGFQPYLTSVGGSGLGILSPYDYHSNHRNISGQRAARAGQITPPETPNTGDESSIRLNVGNAAGILESLRPSFGSIPELSSWAESLGHWLYV